MKERPILFSGAMVRAILEGRKTVTRRALSARALQHIEYGARCDECHPLPVDGGIHPNDASYYVGFCPYGQPGDRLWVRETWCGPVVDTEELEAKRADGWAQFRKPEYCQYRASGGCNEYFDESRDETVARWRPSIHMPRWASRILLEITAVRVERLQDISEEQARSEGVKGEPCDHARQVCSDIGCWGDTAKGAFGFLWESLNGSGSWAANPWVWVVEFKRVMQ